MIHRSAVVDVSCKVGLIPLANPVVHCDAVKSASLHFLHFVEFAKAECQDRESFQASIE